jgi:hypothetical protein
MKHLHFFKHHTTKIKNASSEAASLSARKIGTAGKATAKFAHHTLRETIFYHTPLQTIKNAHEREMGVFFDLLLVNIASASNVRCDPQTSKDIASKLEVIGAKEAELERDHAKLGKYLRAGIIGIVTTTVIGIAGYALRHFGVELPPVLDKIISFLSFPPIIGTVVTGLLWYKRKEVNDMLFEIAVTKELSRQMEAEHLANSK